MTDDAPTTPREPLAPQFLFRIAGTLLLCPASAVEAVTSFESPVLLPRVPAHVLGLVTYDQRALVLVDAALFLDLPERSATKDRARTLVLSTGPYRVGLPVESALGVISLDSESVSEGAHVFTGRLAEFVRAEANTESGVAGVVDLDLLLEAARV